jgi:cellobiose-specific phosphotransferase system component IIA
MIEWMVGIILFGVAISMYIILYKYEKKMDQMQALIDMNKKRIDMNKEKIEENNERINKNHDKIKELKKNSK